jgi:serine/threonine-protein kinase HipA
MIIEKIHNCLITLEEMDTPYSKKGKRQLFGYRDCSHIMPYTLNESSIEFREKILANQTRISISGVQNKLSMHLQKKQLMLTDIGGTYIVKPKTTNLLYNEYVPINEHLTMLIAKNVFGIETAACGLAIFKDGEPAYVTKRFDVAKDGTRYLKEDFASVLQRTENTHGKDYKYEGSYEDMAKAIDAFIPTAMLQKENLFKLIVFNYLMSNGDAHLKNFSIISYDMAQPYYVLAPAYDLLCTRLHINDEDFALKNQLFENDMESAAYQTHGHHTYHDFYDFGIKIGLAIVRLKRILNNFLQHKEQIEKLVQASYLNAELKEKYLYCYNDRLRKLSKGFEN